MRHVVVVGSGWSAIAALWALGDAVDVRATWVRGGAGASALSSGALDGVDGDAESAHFLDWIATVTGGGIARAPGDVASFYGAVRACDARSASVLGLPSRRARVWVADAPLLGWDGRAVAARLNEELAAGGGSAVAIGATLLFTADEQHEQLVEIARRHDARGRAEWLVARVREAIAARSDRADALLLPPILGLDAALAESLRRALAMPVGETLGDVGGPTPLRWSRLLDAVTARLLDERGARLTLVTSTARAWSTAKRSLSVDDSPEIQADSLLLATGGVFAGGLVYGGGEHDVAAELPRGPKATLRTGVAFDDDAIVPVTDGAGVDASSLFGADGEAFLDPRAPKLVSAGLPCDGAGRVLDRFGRPVDGLFVAGDLVADRARTIGAAIGSGVRAARGAVNVGETR